MSFDDDDDRSRQKFHLTYPDGNAVLVTPGRELDDELRAGLLLGVIERSEPADHFDAILGGDLSLPRRLHCHRERGGDDDTVRTRVCVYLTLESFIIGATDYSSSSLHLLLGYYQLLPATLRLLFLAASNYS